jgi:hypothetical protein
MVRRKQALAATPGAGIGDKSAEEAVLEPGAHAEIPGFPCRTHHPCALVPDAHARSGFRSAAAESRPAQPKPP